MISRYIQGQQVTATSLNELVDAVNKFEAMTGDGLIRVRRTSGGTVLSIDPDLLGVGRTTVNSFIAGITGFTSSGSNRWLYAWSEAEKTAAGYAGWTIKTGGRSGTTSTLPAYNFVEDMNSGSGVQGNGVNLANLDTADFTFAIQPAPDGLMAIMHEIKFSIGESNFTEYWFGYESGVDGSCD